ncbi:MAG: ABC transporter substrate-binding protein [Vallitalea sp.]|jgi:iron complex transport system substrate-binding protein|nr:ABC transporter substrate-binding protein [Vallitalea sp.]
MNSMRMRVISIGIIISLLTTLLTGCTDIENDNKKEVGANSKEYERVAIISPPILSVYLGTVPDKNRIVGVNSRAYDTANQKVIKELFPSYDKVDTSFINKKFITNTEQLLKLDPDIVFYYGNAQKKGIEKLTIPTIDMLYNKSQDPEKITIEWENNIMKLFNVEKENTIKKEWEKTNQRVEDILENIETKKKGLYIFSYINGKITVSGKNTYGDNFFEMSGIENVATDIEGNKEASMEQILQWNPEVIYIFLGMPASPIINNEVNDQDWSLIQATKDKAIYDIPQAAYSWGAPCEDSPLMPLWLIYKTYPSSLDKDEFIKEFKGYYKRIYDVELDDEIIEDVLNPKMMKKGK